MRIKLWFYNKLMAKNIYLKVEREHVCNHKIKLKRKKSLMICDLILIYFYYLYYLILFQFNLKLENVTTK